MFIPPYRIDIITPIDIVEEVAIGYGIDNLESTILYFQSLLEHVTTILGKLMR